MRINDLGLRPYKEVWELQKELLAKRIEDAIEDTLILCEHFPIITYGKSAKDSHLIADRESLKKKGIECIEVERGGDITWHGPGQLVAYPILNLQNHKKDVHWYMRELEEVIIRTLSAFDLTGERVDGKTGVWIQRNSHSNKPSEHRKIASLGVKISRWCTMHGLALNVCNSLEDFSLMHPCGLKNISMTSMQYENDALQTDFNLVKETLVRIFQELFS